MKNLIIRKRFDLATTNDSLRQVFFFATIMHNIACTTQIYVLHTNTLTTMKQRVNCCHKMKSTNNIPCWNSRKIVERGKIDTTYTHVHDSSLGLLQALL